MTDKVKEVFRKRHSSSVVRNCCIKVLSLSLSSIAFGEM